MSTRQPCASPAPDRTPRHVVIRIAALATADPRTVRAWLDGRTPHGTALVERLERAAADLGIVRDCDRDGRAA